MLTRIFRRSSTARKRAATADRWEGTANHLLASKVDARAKASAFTRENGHTAEGEVLWQLAMRYTEAERNARAIAQNIREGK